MIAAGIIAALTYYIVVLRKDSGETYDYITAEKSDLIQEVSVTGKVKPAESVDLAFERSGRVAGVSVRVGDTVHAGQILTQLESGELSAQLLQAQANLAAEEAKLREFEEGTRPEEIQIAITKVGNAERTLQDAENDLLNIINKAGVDLQSDYDGALSAALKAVTAGKSALITLSDIQQNYFTSYSQEDSRLAEAKGTAVEALLGTSGAGLWKTEYINELNGGTFKFIHDISLNPTHETIDQALPDTLVSLRKVSTALEAVPSTGELTATDKTNLGTEKKNMSTEISSVSSEIQAIAVQKVTNANAIADAEAAVNSAKNALATAHDELSLKEAGIAPEQIAAQKARVNSARASKQQYQAEIAKTIMKAPFDGVVIAKDIEMGEVISANAKVISLNSQAQFEIEANIPEADIAKVTIGDNADITLDAYGSDISFDAYAVSIEPAETVVEGVPTYVTKFHFLEKDDRPKSGMTANITITTDIRKDVIAIPQRAVVRNNGTVTVRILRDNLVHEVTVETGLRGSDGNIEIINGVSEGDKVIIFLEEK